MEIKVPISIGELVDKLTILEIKKDRIADLEKLVHVRTESDALEEAFCQLIDNPEVKKIRCELKRVNSQLWEVEDQLREFEAKKNFGTRFVELARKVYLLNDERARLKKKINLLVGSKLIEEKSYKSY